MKKKQYVCGKIQAKNKRDNEGGGWAMIDESGRWEVGETISRGQAMDAVR